ncbi:MAG: UDP-4-amino-4,6-dideoxy-N-acetyl-beta-L-altrosamine N-acetyltransferase [Ruminococcus sp.]|nr:UDP-4-amino-4,6-dideoxy-N-acetyl-beta-L-altrosamine N-acetyltransferase [Ruminococcus sp.]
MSNVTIRPASREDASNIVRWRNSPSVMSYFIYRTPLTEEGHLRWFEEKVASGEVVQFIITLDGRDVGSVYFQDIDRVNKKCEYGIFIGDESCRGKGAGSQAAKLALDYAFEELKMNRVYLRVFADNERAIKSYENAGFKFEGKFRQDVIIDGKAYDMVFMAILKEDWKKDN